jgi:hypothetical protein
VSLGGRTAVHVAAGFFALGGLLHIGLAVFGQGFPPQFWTVWEALGRGLISLVVAWGLLRRLAAFRSLAWVYCAVMLLTYLAVLCLAYTRTRALYPWPLIIESLYEIPACALLLPYFLSEEAQEAFSRSLF